MATTAHNKKMKEKEKLALKEQNETLLKQLEMYREKEENSQSMLILFFLFIMTILITNIKGKIFDQLTRLLHEEQDQYEEEEEQEILPVLSLGITTSNFR